MNRITNMVVISPDDGHAGRVTLPVCKRLNHRGLLSIDVSTAWYFITICAEEHAPWVMAKPVGRAVAPRPPSMAGNVSHADWIGPCVMCACEVWRNVV
jgi:hypothetical protein